MLKKIYIKLKSKLYFLPMIYSLFSVLLAGLVVYIDSDLNMISALSFLYTSRTMGSVILSTILGSLLTMLTITFSIMMVVLTIYGNQLSPRSLQDFLEKKLTLRILSYFIGALIFTIISLFAVKSGQFDSYLISPAISVILLIIAVFVFAYFIHYIAKSVQINHYVFNLTQSIDAMIDKYQKVINDDPNINTENLEELANFKDIPFKQITARASGFIQYYDEFKLYEYAKDQGVTISCINMIGKHVLVDSPILLVYDHQNIEDKTDLTETLLSFVTIGDEPNIDDDIATGTKKTS